MGRNLFRRAFSKSLPMTGSKLMERYDEDKCLALFGLCTSIMTANFQILGKWDNLSIEFYMWVSNDKVLRDRFFRILFVMRSFSGALPGDNFLIIGILNFTRKDWFQVAT
jgi:hypothetical protein